MTIDDLRLELEARRIRNCLIFKITFDEAIKTLMKEKHWYKEHFMEQTGLNEGFYYRIYREEDYNFEVRSIVAMCIGLKLDLPTAENLMVLRGRRFSPFNLVHQVYRIMIEHSADLDIEQCNEMLNQLGFEESNYLGSQERKSGKGKIK